MEAAKRRRLRRPTLRPNLPEACLWWPGHSAKSPVTDSGKFEGTPVQVQTRQPDKGLIRNAYGLAAVIFMGCQKNHRASSHPTGKFREKNDQNIR